MLQIEIQEKRDIEGDHEVGGQVRKRMARGDKSKDNSV